MNEQGRATDSMSSHLAANATSDDQLQAHGWLRVECVGEDGRVKWLEEGPNLIVTAGRNKLLDEALAGSSYTATWYVGLINNSGFSAIAAADTMSSHAGWTEFTTYTEANRQTMAFSAASAGSKATSANNSFTIDTGGGTVNGAFVTSNNTKGGTTGVLFAAKSFSAARTVAQGDTLNVGYTATLTAS